MAEIWCPGHLAGARRCGPGGAPDSTSARLDSQEAYAIVSITYTLRRQLERSTRRFGWTLSACAWAVYIRSQK